MLFNPLLIGCIYSPRFSMNSFIIVWVTVTQTITYYRNPTKKPARMTETIVTLINPPTSIGGSI